MGPSLCTGAWLGGSTHLAWALFEARPSVPGVRTGSQGPTCLAALKMAVGARGPEKEPRIRKRQPQGGGRLQGTELQVGGRAWRALQSPSPAQPGEASWHISRREGRAVVGVSRALPRRPAPCWLGSSFPGPGQDAGAAWSLRREGHGTSRHCELGEVIPLQVTVELRSGRGCLVTCLHWTVSVQETRNGLTPARSSSVLDHKCREPAACLVAAMGRKP